MRAIPLFLAAFTMASTAAANPSFVEMREMLMEGYRWPGVHGPVLRFLAERPESSGARFRQTEIVRLLVTRSQPEDREHVLRALSSRLAADERPRPFAAVLLSLERELRALVERSPEHGGEEALLLFARAAEEGRARPEWMMNGLLAMAERPEPVVDGAFDHRRVEAFLFLTRLVDRDSPRWLALLKRGRSEEIGYSANLVAQAYWQAALLSPTERPRLLAVLPELVGAMQPPQLCESAPREALRAALPLLPDAAARLDLLIAVLYRIRELSPVRQRSEDSPHPLFEWLRAAADPFLNHAEPALRLRAYVLTAHGAGTQRFLYTGREPEAAERTRVQAAPSATILREAGRVLGDAATSPALLGLTAAAFSRFADRAEIGPALLAHAGADDPYLRRSVATACVRHRIPEPRAIRGVFALYRELESPSTDHRRLRDSVRRWIEAAPPLRDRAVIDELVEYARRRRQLEHWRERYPAARLLPYVQLLLKAEVDLAVVRPALDVFLGLTSEDERDALRASAASTAGLCPRHVSGEPLF